MNKKGFTLIELLATVAILVLMALVIGVNITSILRSTEKQNEVFDKEQIEKAACVYVDSDTLCPNKNCDNSVTVEKLINEGLLDKKEYGDKTGTITVTRTNGVKVCKYTE